MRTEWVHKIHCHIDQCDASGPVIMALCHTSHKVHYKYMQRGTDTHDSHSYMCLICIIWMSFAKHIIPVNMSAHRNDIAIIIASNMLCVAKYILQIFAIRIIGNIQFNPNSTCAQRRFRITEIKTERHQFRVIANTSYEYVLYIVNIKDPHTCEWSALCSMHNIVHDRSNATANLKSNIITRYYLLGV